MKKLFFVFSAFLITSHSFGQNLQNANWCFGYHARVDFNSPPPVTMNSNIIPENYSLNVASVSDDNGVLQFYTNGVTVWGKDGNPMFNGHDLWGAYTTGTQNIVIVPKPNHPFIYYIFIISFNNPPPIVHGGIHYSVVDMSLNNQNGDIVQGQKNISLKDHTGALIDFDYSTGTGLKIEMGKITTTLNSSKDKIWVAFLPRFDVGGVTKRYVYSYLITENGIHNGTDGPNPRPDMWTELDNSNYPGNPLLDGFGTAKFSPDGAYLCDAATTAVNLYRFDQTGGVTFERTVINVPPVSHPAYGLEFSPNKHILPDSTEVYYIYFSINHYIDQEEKIKAILYDPYIYLYQYDMGKYTKTLIGKFRVPLDSLNNPIPTTDLTWGLQLAIDNKIYVCNDGGGTFYGRLGAIQLPDLAYPGCSYNPNELQLAQGTNHWTVLPQWVHKAKEDWPKAYGTIDGPLWMIKDYQGDVIFGAAAFITNSTFYNHMGVFPPPSQPYSNTLQYTQSGITNWISEKNLPIFSLRSGVVQMKDLIQNPPGNYFINGTTGNTVTPPVSLLRDEEIIAETKNGAIITEDWSTSGPILNIHINGNTIPFNPGFNFSMHYYNLDLDDLLLIGEVNNFYYLGVYHFDGTNFTQQYVGPLPVNFNGGYTFIIDNLNKIYFTDQAGVLIQYDYTSGGISPVNIPGFNNQSLFYYQPINTSGYTSDRFLVFNSSDNYIYALNVDVINMSSRKILTSNFSENFQYAIDGNDLYISGWYCSSCTNQTEIGNQILPNINQNTAPVFITKLNLQTDFQRPEQVSGKEPNPNTNINPIKIAISPNPVNSELNVRIYENERTSHSPFNITVTNQMTTVVLQRKNYFSGGNINVSALKTGVYYLTATNKNGLSKSVVFLKL